MKILQNPDQLRMLRRALNEEIHGSIQYAKELQNTPEWKKIKVTEQKLRDRVCTYTLLLLESKHFDLNSHNFRMITSQKKKPDCLHGMCASIW